MKKNNLFNNFFSFSFAVTLLILVGARALAQTASLPWGISPKHYFTISDTTIQVENMLYSDHVATDKISAGIIAYNTNLHRPAGHEWTTIPGWKFWSLKIRVPNANRIGVVLSDVRLVSGEKIFIYNQNGLQNEFDMGDVPPSGILISGFLNGDDIVIEYDSPEKNTDHGGFLVEAIAHGFETGTIKKQDTDTRIDNTSSCYPCLDGATLTQEQRAVVKLIVYGINSTRICTGTLVNNTRQDNTPYVLTAQHCVTNQQEADRTAFIFDYEDDRCAGRVSRVDLIGQGSYFRASSFESDFSLLELYRKPPLEFVPYYAGWDLSARPPAHVHCIHHPHGGPKEISLSNTQIQTSDFNDGSPRTTKGFWRVPQWDQGATEGGSSGAALFDNTGHVIGTLSGGSSECASPYNDYFEKLSVTWNRSENPDNQLQYWLDPTYSGATSMDGVDPFEGIIPDCTTQTNVPNPTLLNLIPYSKNWGYYAGCNADSTTGYAELFLTADTILLTSVALNVGSVNHDSQGGLFVSIMTEENGRPGREVTRKYIPYYQLFADSINVVDFYPFITLNENFFVGYEMSYSKDDTFSLKQSDWSSNSANTSFADLPSGWVPLSAISPGNKNSSLGITISTCRKIVVRSVQEKIFPIFFPNPATSFLIAKLYTLPERSVVLHVVNTQGKEQTVSWATYDDNIVLTTSELAPGIYVINLLIDGTIFRTRFVKL